MDESPIPPRTRLNSRCSLYQSDYETAAEDSDGSLYYSLFDDEDKENDSDDNHLPMTPRSGLSTRRTLLGQCLQKNLNHTPRNEFNKRISINVNPVLSSTSMSSPTTAFRGGLPGILFETQTEVTKKTKNDELSHGPICSSTTDNIAGMFDSLNRATINDGIDSGILEIDEEDSNNTIVPETVSEATEEIKDEAIEEPQVPVAAVTTSTTTSSVNLKTTSIPCGPHRFGPASTNPHTSTTFGLSNLPVPKKISIAELAHPPAVAPKGLNGPPTRRISVFRCRSTENYGFSRPNGKSGIPKVSLMLARNSAFHPSVVSSQSSQSSSSSSQQSKCDYCDKTFAKRSILDVHLLDKCEKIPPARHRQLSRQLSNPN